MAFQFDDAWTELLDVVRTGQAKEAGFQSPPFRIEGSTIMAVATIRVRVPDPGPQLVDDEVETSPNAPVEFNPLANDADPLGRRLRLVRVAQPPQGSMEVLADGTTSDARVRYTPPANWAGETSCEYEAVPVTS